MEEKVNYDEYFYFDKDYHEMVTNKDTFKKTLQKFLDNAIDEITLGIIFEVHRKHKTIGFDPDPVITGNTHLVAGVHDIHGFDSMSKIKSICDCPNCNRNVSASRFASHLEKCMGFGRKTNPSRGNALNLMNNNNNSNNSSNSNNSAKEKDDDPTYSSAHSEDGDCNDDDDDWNSRNSKKKKRKHRSKSKKGKGTPKKNNVDQDSGNVDVEGDEDCGIMLRDIMQDNSNQSSPAESVASSNASKKREKTTTKKKAKRERANFNLE